MDLTFSDIQWPLTITVVTKRGFILSQVCEEYKLHRETYYLATDFHDRFMDSWKSIQKEHLQAIGITCLFIASKIEVSAPHTTHGV